MRRAICGFVAAAIVLALPSLALAHLERPSYWPDPGPDTSVKPAAGGEVPTARTLKSAVSGKGPGEVRVVCVGRDGAKSLKVLAKSLRTAQRKGFSLRPSIPLKNLKAKRAANLKRLNQKLAAECGYTSVQAAVNDSSNNDRVVIMPGVYREPKSRKAALNDPKCADLTTISTSGASTPSYAYQATCPNDQNLIFVQGREIGETPPPSPPIDDRHGIPDEGPCVRCNLQIEGSGLLPDDVILDGGKNYESKAADARPGETVKHVVLRADRADGFVGRNFTMRGSKEFGFYTEETDGILLDRVKFFWAADYGHLSFTTDHNVIQNCEALGAGDAGVYPGASPETGSQATSFYPDAPRINTVVRKCDLHGNVLAYSGSMGNAVRITENEIYGNTAGISTDTISASGHPGFPADSVEIDNNNIYSNNLDLYGVENPRVPPIVGVLPVGVGIFWAGHNDGNVHDNRIFDNWRYGAQLLAVPDAAVALLDDFEPEGGVDPGISCPLPGQISTSCNNKFHDNNMGIPPPGFEPSPEVKRFGNVTGLPAPVAANGTDFWWDEFVANPGNCWFDNTGSDGTEASVTGPGVGTPPDILPDETICGSYMGTSDSAKESNLVNCFTARSGGDKSLCDWYTMPPQPGTGAARAYRRDEAERARALALSRDGQLIEDNVAALAERAAAAPQP